MASIGTVFTSTIYHTKQLNAWPNPSASCMANYSWLSAFRGEKEPFKDHPSTCGCLTSLRNKPQQSLGKLHYQYLPELLVNVYSCCLMKKSVSCCYGVEGKSSTFIGCHYSMEWNRMFCSILSGMEQLFNIDLHTNFSCLGLWSDICSYWATYLFSPLYTLLIWILIVNVLPI